MSCRLVPRNNNPESSLFGSFFGQTPSKNIPFENSPSTTTTPPPCINNTATTTMIQSQPNYVQPLQQCKDITTPPRQTEPLPKTNVSKVIPLFFCHNHA